VLERIGSGGMGVVWQARDERLQRLVAVKQLLLGPALSPRDADEARARALREARIAARLQHPNAIVVYDVVEHDGEPCIVMEYLPSRSLAAVLGEQVCLPVAEVASIGRQIASALAAAHAAQIVHRDVKPGNILIAEDGTAKITDFGVSRAAGDVTVTQTGMMAGTPAYLAPEVARGQLPTQASDVFSLGATLYAALEGIGPFGDNDNPLALLHAVASGQVAPPQHAGPLSVVVMRLLAKDPAARPDMLRASLELAAAPITRPLPGAAQPPRPAQVLRPAPAVAPTVASVPPPSRSTSNPPAPDAVPQPASPSLSQPRHVRAGVLVGVVLALLAFAGGGALLFRGPSSEQARSAGDTGSVSAPPVVTPSAESPPPPQVEPVDHVQSIAWRDAGQLVIDYYNGLDDPSAAWGLLSPAAQATFGNESSFRSYWAQYTSVSARNASGVTDNPDGTVRVPVDVTYHRDGSNQVIKRSLQVTRLNGELLIASDPR
jgi:eukaryotic-like serine/threonine-protein kinase